MMFKLISGLYFIYKSLLLNLQYKTHLVGNKIEDHSDVVGEAPVACSSNYIFILNLKPDFDWLGKGN